IPSTSASIAHGWSPAGGNGWYSSNGLSAKRTNFASSRVAWAMYFQQSTQTGQQGTDPKNRCLGRQGRASFATHGGAARTTFSYPFGWCRRPRKPGRKTREQLSRLRPQKASAPQQPSAVCSRSQYFLHF